jgi:hypothetical protein
MSSICGCIIGSPPAIDTIGRPGFLDGSDRALNRHPLPEQIMRLLDLAATVALEVAGEQRFQLDDQRKLLDAANLFEIRYQPMRALCRMGMAISPKPPWGA